VTVGLATVDWSKTRAYGVGFQGLYLNRRGRELDDPATPEDESGIVAPGAEADALARELKAKLEALVDPATGRRPILRCDLASEVYSGARAAEAPDVIVGYDSGYGNSDLSTMGRIPCQVLEDNAGGSFNGSHLMAAEVVAGTLIANRAVRADAHRLEDLTVEVLDLFGIPPQDGMKGHAVLE
jgi:predicted AlkP superfamily phosphohydrolase/phosphomutase